MQLASVCSTFAAASEQVLRGGGRLCLEAVGGIGECQLSSMLMLKLARHLRHIHFYDDTMCLPGSQDFMAAASSLRSVSVHCDTVLAAAEANYLLSGSSSICEVALSGTYRMTSLPHQSEILRWPSLACATSMLMWSTIAWVPSLPMLPVVGCQNCKMSA